MGYGAPALGVKISRVITERDPARSKLLLALLIFFFVRAMAQNFRVEGSSMEPGLHDGQYLLVNKAVYFKVNVNTLAKYLPFIHKSEAPERFLFRGPSTTTRESITRMDLVLNWTSTLR